MQGKKIEGLTSSQEFSGMQKRETIGKPLQDYQIWANLATFSFEKTV